MRLLLRLRPLLVFLASFVGTAGAAESFRVATYNLENYLDQPTETRAAKSTQAKQAVRQSILELRPDVLALQEMGSRSALEELRGSLKANGLDFPYWEHVRGFDTNIHVAILSRFPFAAVRSHTNENFLLNGRRFQVSRGFGEVDIKVNDHYQFTLITAHLKSKRPIPVADEAEMRLEEAKLLREKISQRLVSNPNVNLVVVGDFNDNRDSVSTREIVGRGKLKLVDSRPAERNGDNVPNPNSAFDPRNITWTHYYGKEDSYSRIDYLLMSQGMAREVVPADTYVLSRANWGVGSDHRPLVATFEATDK